MWWIYDLAVIAIVALFGFFCYKKGLVKTLILFLGYAISAVAAKILSTIASTWIYSSFISKNVVNMISEKIGEASLTVGEGINAAISSLPGIFKNAVNFMMSSNASIEEGVNEAVLEKGQSLAASIESTIIAPMATFLIQSVLFFVLFVLCYFLVKRIAFIATFVNKIPLVGPLNRTLGAAVGILEGIVIVYLCAFLVYVFVMLTNGQYFFNADDISKTYIFKLLYENNPLTFFKPAV